MHLFSSNLRNSFGVDVASCSEGSRLVGWKFVGRRVRLGWGGSRSAKGALGGEDRSITRPMLCYS